MPIKMRNTLSFCLLASFALSGCTTFWDVVAYKAPEGRAKATLMVKNSVTSVEAPHTVNVHVLGTPNCAGRFLALSAPLDPGKSVAKEIEANTPFNFMLTSQYRSSGFMAGVVHTQTCGPWKSRFMPRQGANYHIEVTKDDEEGVCRMLLTESRPDGTRVEVPYKDLNINGC